MPSPRVKDALNASVLDRLLDHAPKQKTEPVSSRSQIISELRESVRRDLELLLNTRRRCDSCFITGRVTDKDDMDAVLLDYGIADYSSLNFNDDNIKNDFIKQLETIILANETRFSSLTIQALDAEDHIDRTFRFRIEALLNVEPTVKPIAFDSSMDPVTRNFVVKDSNHG